MMDWLRKLSFSTKMTVIAIAGMVPMLFLTVLALSDKQKNIDVSEREIAGLHRYKNLEAMLLPVGMHEIWSAASVAGEGAAEKLQAATADVSRAVSQQDSINEDYGAPAGEDARRWSDVKLAWSSMTSGKPASVGEVVRLHSELR